MADLVGKIVLIHGALENAGVPHAFGGALALAWCTERARGTIDIDVNAFIPAQDCTRVLDALPKEVKVTKKDAATLKRDGQVRVWWDRTPVDLFLNTTPFHDDVARRVRWERFGDRAVPFLSCLDLAVFKAFFNRTKDWADLEEMNAVGTLDIEEVSLVLTKYLGSDDERILKLNSLRQGTVMFRTD